MTILITNAQERTRFLRFAVVGIIGAIIDFGVMNAIVKLLAAPLVLAGTVSFVAAVTSNFTWNRYWTYPDSRSKSIPQQLLQFFIVNTMGLGIRVPILRYLEPWLYGLSISLPFRLPVISPDFFAKNATLAVAVVIVMFWNFFANRYWTYSDVS